MLANQQVLIRIPVALEDDGSVFCVGEVPENTMLIMLHQPLARYTMDTYLAHCGSATAISATSHCWPLLRRPKHALWPGCPG
jgi:hypothetical protein